MKTQELSIGNIVKIDDEYLGPIEGKVTSLKESGEVELLLSVSKGNGRHFVCGSDDIFPIPITDELLLKCGFGEPCDGVYECGCGKFEVTKEGDEWWVSWHGGCDYWFAIKYLHQLQNAYCLVTGKELEIKI